MLSFIQFLLENRLDFVKDIYAKKGVNTSHDPGALTDTGAIVDHFATNADPSQRKVHTQWIMNKYNRGEFRQEDHPRVRQALSLFDQYKSRLDRKDLNQYNSLAELEGAVAGLSGPASNKQAKKEAKETGAELIHNQDGVTVHHIKTKEASCQYGAGTRWCTAAKDDSDNQFSQYNSRGSLYVIQHNGRKFQFYNRKDNSGQTMADEKDISINMKDMPLAIRKSLAKSSHPEIQKANLFLKNDQIPSKVADDATDNNNIYIRRAGLLHPSLSKEKLNDLIQNGNYDTMFYLTQRPDATPKFLSDVYNHRLSGSTMRENIAAHPNLDYNLMTKIANDTNTDSIGSRFGLVHNPKLRPEHIDALMKSSVNHLRVGAISHKNATPAQIKNAIENDTDDQVKMAAARNQNIDEDTLVKSAVSPDIPVSAGAKNNPKFNATHIDRVISHIKSIGERGEIPFNHLVSLGGLFDSEKSTAENLSNAIKTHNPQIIHIVSMSHKLNTDHANQIMNLPDDPKFSDAKQGILRLRNFLK